MTKLLIKLFIVSLIGQICFACFKEAPVSTARKVLKITDPSPSAAECEKVCTADANCKAYAYYGTTCGMFGDVVEENKVFVRGTDCVQRDGQVQFQNWNLNREEKSGTQRDRSACGRVSSPLH